MISYARKLNVYVAGICLFIAVLSDMLEGLGISVSDGVAIVCQVQFPVLIPRTDQEMLGVEMVVNKVLEVVILQNGYDLGCEHECGLQSEFVITFPK